MNATNALNWFEIPTIDIDRAQRFYQAMLAIDLKRDDFGGTPHAVFPAGERGVTGSLVQVSDRKPSGDGTLLYLNVEGKLDACLGRTAQAGGKVVQPRTAIGPHGFIAAVRDPEGNVIGLHSMT